MNDFHARSRGLRTGLFVALVAILLLGLQPARAQVNIERMRWRSPEDGWSTNLDLGFNLKRGNAEVTDVSAAATIGYRSGEHLAFLVGNGEYGSQGSVRYLNRVMTHLRYNYHLHGPWTTEAFTQIEEDEFRLLLRRTLFGAGMRWETGRDGPLHAAVGAALMVEELLYDLPAGHPDASETALRESSYGVVNWRIREGVSFHTIVYVQPKLTDVSDVRGSGETALSVKLHERLTFAASLSLSYDSDPVGNVETYDLTLRNTLSYSF